MSGDGYIDQDEIEETLAEVRDHLRASDIVSLVEHDQMAALEMVANLYAIVRHVSGTIGRLTLVLRRIPDSGEWIADHLDGLAAVLDEFVLGEAEATSEEVL